MNGRTWRCAFLPDWPSILRKDTVYEDIYKIAVAVDN